MARKMLKKIILAFGPILWNTSIAFAQVNINQLFETIVQVQLLNHADESVKNKLSGLVVSDFKFRTDNDTIYLEERFSCEGGSSYRLWNHQNGVEVDNMGKITCFKNIKELYPGNIPQRYKLIEAWDIDEILKRGGSKLSRALARNGYATYWTTRIIIKHNIPTTETIHYFEPFFGSSAVR